MPPDSCSHCGDGTQPGHELCDACEKAKADAARSTIPAARTGGRFYVRGVGFVAVPRRRAAR